MPQSGSASLDRKIGGINFDSGRTTFVDTFVHRPALAANTVPTVCAVTAAQAAFMLAANRDWEAIGTNMTSALCTHSTGGGITLTTAGAGDDQAFIKPTTVTSPSKSGIATWDWSTTDEIAFRARIKTSTSIAGLDIVAGYWLTLGTPFLETTDADSVSFMFSTESTVSAANWLTHTAVAGTDQDYDTGEAVVASTTTDLALFLDSSRVPHFFIDGKQVHQGPAMTVDIDLIPFIGINDTAGAEKAITVRRVGLGKKDND